jgi:vacuolar-type H+-ATPase subunit D/Vma8
LRAEIVTLKRDHELLEKKHAALLGQFQAVAGQRPKPQKKRRK